MTGSVVDRRNSARLKLVLRPEARDVAPAFEGRIPSAIPYTTFETWFGDDDAPLFGSVSLPTSGLVRGAAVLCAPLGKEHITTYRGMRQLAERLAASGIMVLRFDYRGQGDSFGDQADPNAVAQWLTSIESAFAYVREAGVERVSLVGLRVGALLASQVASSVGPLESVVLWDPVVSGRSYMREQRALYKMTIGDDDASDSRVSILGSVLDPRSADHIESLRLAASALGESGAPTLCVVRPENLDSRPVRSLIDATGAELQIATGQNVFVNPASFVFNVPTSSVEEIARWVSRHHGRSTTVVAPRRTDTATVDVRADGTEVRETIEYRGPHRILAISTFVGRRSDDDARVILHSTASEHRLGPVRLWVESARDIASNGIGAIRFDRRGTGDSDIVRRDENTSPMSPEAREDVRDLVESLDVAAARTIHVGMCSGSWHSAYAADRYGAASVVLVNTVAWSLKRTRQPVKAATVTAMDSSVASNLFVLAKKVRNAVRIVSAHIPYPVWRLLGAAGIAETPESMLGSLTAKGVDVKVILSPDDHAQFVSQRGELGLGRLRSRGANAEVDVFDVGDHSLYHRDLRGMVALRIKDTVAKSFGGTADAAEPAVRLTVRAL